MEMPKDTPEGELSPQQETNQTENVADGTEKPSNTEQQNQPREAPEGMETGETSVPDDMKDAPTGEIVQNTQLEDNKMGHTKPEDNNMEDQPNINIPIPLIQKGTKKGWVPTVDLDALKDVKSPDQTISEYKIKFIENWMENEVNEGKLFISRLHGLLFEGSHHLQIPFLNVRWMTKLGPLTEECKNLAFSVVLSFEEMETKEISYIFFECEAIDKTVIEIIYKMKLDDLETAVKCSQQEREKVMAFLQDQPSEINAISAKIESNPQPPNVTGDTQTGLFVMVYDLECMSFFEGQTRRPDYQAKFWKDEGPGVVEMVKIIHADNEVHLSTDCNTLILKQTWLMEQSLKKMVAKNKNLFTDARSLFSTASEHIRTDPALPIPLPSWTPDVYPPPGASSSPKSLTIQGEMNDAVDSLGKVEDIKLKWITMEADLMDILNSGDVMETEIQSGGLNQDNEEHLERALTDVADQLTEERLDIALSRMQAARKLFLTSRSSAIRNLFDCSDLELMKKLYYRSLMK